MGAKVAIVLDREGIRSHVPYELLVTEVFRNTLTRKVKLHSFFSEEELERLEGFKSKAHKWMTSSPQSIELTTDDLFLWDKVGNFLSTIL